MKKHLIIIFVCLLFLSSCTKKEDPYIPYVPPSVLEHLEETIETEGTTSANGKNEAYSFSPCDGITIDVPENVLYEDTVLSMDNVTEDTPGIEKLIEGLYEENVYALRAWQIDAGLENDQCLPGSYNVSIDLDEMGVDESLYDCVRIMRVNDDGVLSTLCSDIEANTLTYSSNRNSIIVMVIVGIAIAPIVVPAAWGASDYIKAEGYYEMNLLTGNLTWHAWYDMKYASFDVQYLVKDLDPDVQKKIDRCAEIKEAYRKQIRENTRIEKRAAWDVFGLFSRNASEAELLDKALKKDAEYKKLQSQISRPSLLDGIIFKIITAFQYLKKQNIKMPGERVRFYLRPDVEQLGNTVWNLFEQSHIEISLRDVALLNSDTEEGRKKQDNLLLTITHELFHVCQTYYHTHLFSDSTRFDEMVAVALESEARDYYYTEGKIKTKPDLTDQDHWLELESPIDSFDLEEITMRNQGYCLSLLIPYLKKATGKKDVTIGSIMDARSYDEKPNTTGPLCKAFGIKEEDFDKYWYGFLKENRQRATGKNMDKNIVAANTGKLSSISTNGDYSVKVKGFFQTTSDPLPLLVVFDDPSLLNDQRMSVFPTGEYKIYRNGFYIPAQKSAEDAKNNPRRWIIEVFGKQNSKPVTGSYTVWGMGKTPKAKMDVSYISDKLFIYMSSHSELAYKGLIDGYYIKLETDNGVKMEGHRPVDDLRKGLTVPFEKLYNGDKTKDVNITVTACEYVKDNDGNYLYGITSEPLLYKLSGVPDIELDDNPGSDDDPHPLSEQEQWLNSLSFGYPLEMYCYYAASVDEGVPTAEIVSQLEGSSITIADDGTFTLSIPSSNATHETHDNGKDKYYDVTLSFKLTAKMTPRQVLHPEDYDPDLIDKCWIDYGLPVFVSAEVSRKTSYHEEGLFNGSYHYTKDRTADMYGDKANLDDSYSYISYGEYIKDAEGLYPDQPYLILTLDIMFKGIYTGIEDEWYEKTA
ncbi:MAG: hypothetical protein J5883_00615, partial [Clostridiales bacterium]|nr:hypothetical protein [Clostridiales bacterium]